MRCLFRASLDPSTKRSYNRALQDLARFLGAPSIYHISTPFQESDIVHYIAFLFKSGFSFPSITFVVQQALRGVRSLAVRLPKHKFPITPDILGRLCTALNAGVFPMLDSIHLKAMFLLSFHAFLRVGELCGSRHPLLLAQIQVHPAYLRISFQSFKFSAGRCPSVFIPAIPSPLCPVRAVSDYIRVRGDVPGFLFLCSDGVHCTLTQFRRELNRTVKGAGLPACGITPHSFRVGAAAALGIPEDTIQRMGRWSP